MWFFRLLQSERFFHHYQPIVNLQTSEVEGYEALFRSKNFRDPKNAYTAAIRKNRLFELDVHSIQKAIHMFARHGPVKKGRKLFLNVYPSTIMHEDFSSFMLQMIERYALPAGQIVLEIVEHEKITDFNSMSDTLRFLQQMGIMIAVDDFGKGSDDINRTIEIDTDYIKLDRYFSVDLLRSRKKQAYVMFLVHYCHQFNVKLIFEGLETANDIGCAQRLGVLYAQGYALGKPQHISKISRSDEHV
ncbi:EAL domain-containing protein [Sporolactobacillus sp. CPB3-1]|uniref:EAL domain-containing protein n=1 Tax=Sporolactobacillus mangiferae TaxID=2940498 RepID=A0ABT0MDA1_9BACL|nr:EAL domain-containing protein [Sporolactobacillus mangiferae]MCL1632648.1 EAL domain-containing protein [Sporolactobacillus mangiferae]